MRFETTMSSADHLPKARRPASRTASNPLGEDQPGSRAFLRNGQVLTLSENLVCEVHV
jgi:hypothetical protein